MSSSSSAPVAAALLLLWSLYGLFSSPLSLSIGAHAAVIRSVSDDGASRTMAAVMPMPYAHHEGNRARLRVVSVSSSSSLPHRANALSAFVVGRHAPIKVSIDGDGTASIVDGVTYDWSGVEVAASIEPSPSSSTYNLGFAMIYPCITAVNNLHGNLFAVYVDGSVVTELDVGSYFLQQRCGKVASFTVAISVDGSTAHSIRVVKLTEPSYDNRVDNVHNNVTFVAFEARAAADDDTDHSPIVFTPLYGQQSSSSSSSPPLKVEFIGDSITCGCHVNCKGPHDPSAAGYTLESVVNGYPGVTCAALGGGGGGAAAPAAQCSYISWSSRGMALNYYNSSLTVAQLYPYTMATVQGAAGAQREGEEKEKEEGAATAMVPADPFYWDFASFVPNVVVLNLGTNDFANPNIDHMGQAFIDTYAAMLATIATNYDLSSSSSSAGNSASTFASAAADANAKVRIIAVCGPMRYSYCADVRGAMAQAAAAVPHLLTEGKTLFFLQLDDVLNKGNKCTLHPDAAVSVTIAAQLTAFIQKTVLVA